MLSSDRATNLHEYGKSGIGNDESITNTNNSFVYDELRLNRSSNFVNESITIDRVMTQPLEIDETVTSELRTLYLILRIYDIVIQNI